MIDKTTAKLEEMRVGGPIGECAGFFIGKCKSSVIRMQVSDGGGWDHVSVSLATRCPTWDEMCWAKGLWFEPHETVMQLHVAESEHVKYMPFCLHLWRPQTDSEITEIRISYGEEWVYGDLESSGQIPLPPSSMVGPK